MAAWAPPSALDGGDRVLLAGVDDVLGAELARRVSSRARG